MKINETESQALAAQTNSSDVERLTEGTVGVPYNAEHARADADGQKATARASVIDTLGMARHTPAFERRIDRSTPELSLQIACKSLQLPAAHHSARLVHLYAIEQTQQ